MHPSWKEREKEKKNWPKAWLVVYVLVSKVLDFGKKKATYYRLQYTLFFPTQRYVITVCNNCSEVNGS